MLSQRTARTLAGPRPLAAATQPDAAPRVTSDRPLLSEASFLLTKDQSERRRFLGHIGQLLRFQHCVPDEVVFRAGVVLRQMCAPASAAPPKLAHSPAGGPTQLRCGARHRRVLGPLPHGCQAVYPDPARRLLRHCASTPPVGCVEPTLLHWLTRRHVRSKRCCAGTGRCMRPLPGTRPSL